VDGGDEVVLQDAASYQALLEALERAETIAAVREGLASAERGELKEAAVVFSELKAKYGLSG